MEDFKHYLNFLSLPGIGTIQIEEPDGFDGSSYKVKQADGKFARDIIIANEETEITFTRGFFERLSINQTLPSGSIIDYASQGFDYLLDVFNNDGWEGKVEYIIERNGITFVTGVFSYYTSVVEFDNIKVKIIQNTNREVIKRLDDTDIDAFNDTALDGRIITRCETTNILLKAKPIVQNSKWTNETKVYSFTGAGNAFSPFRQIVNSEINNTLTPFDDYIKWNGTGSNPFINFNYIKASTLLSNTTVTFNLKGVANRVGGHLTPNKISLYCFKCREVDFSANWLSATSIYDIDLSVNTNVVFNNTVSVNFENIEIGERIYCIFFYSRISEGGDISISFEDSDLSIIGDSTAIDTVINGVRLIDLARHNTKSLADVELIAPDYDLGGEHYDNFAFNGLLLGQITTKPFYNKFKELFNFGMETCSDYQINPDNVEMLPYSEFYNDINMATFEQVPSYESTSRFNKRYSLKTAEFKYKKSSSERETNAENSIDDVHTETQKFITDTVDTNLKVEINHIRSSYLIEDARSRAFDNSETKSLQNDDNLFLLDCVTLAPSSKGGFGAVLLMRILDNGNLQILNNNLDGDGIAFNWSILGFNNASIFTIISGENVGNYNIITTIIGGAPISVIELEPIAFTPAFDGEAYIVMSWFLSNVNYTNRTNEEFTFIEGIDSPTNYSNLNYSWARNIEKWEAYLATATKFKPNDFIKTASFKINGSLVTRKIGETEDVVDSADIVNSDIASSKILNPYLHTVKVYADFEEMVQLIDDVQNVKGYVTVTLEGGKVIKGFIKEMDYVWVTEELDLILEEKFISDFMEIEPSGVTDFYYGTKIGLNSFQVNNIFVSLYNSNDELLFNPTRFTNIKIEGVQYTDIIDFSDALQTFIDNN